MSEKVRKPDGYGAPVPGSKSEKRARGAHQRISNEIIQLCQIIQMEVKLLCNI